MVWSIEADVQRQSRLIRKPTAESELDSLPGGIASVGRATDLPVSILPSRSEEKPVTSDQTTDGGPYKAQAGKALTESRNGSSPALPF